MNFAGTKDSDTRFEGRICEYFWNPELQKYSLEVLLAHLIRKKEYCQAASPTSDSLKSKYWLSTNNLHSKDHLDNINTIILSYSKYLLINFTNFVLHFKQTF